MKVEDILEDCARTLEEDLKFGSTVELFKAMYPWPLDDIEDIVANIQAIDQRTTSALLEKANRSLMDSERHIGTQAECLMYRLRLENAIRMLTILSRSKVICEVQTAIREEAFLWALTTPWSVCGAQWVYRTARAICDGLPSALPWPVPK